ncbi:MAG: FAD:protein FMN transferase [Halobacteriovoraceae bacterium]|nr:FAD:protein FMN transferase [Halobacteriovoraceae bacterium]
MKNFNLLRVTHTFTAMGGEFQLMCFPQNYLSKKEVIKLFIEAQNEVERIEDKLTDFKDSPFNAININAGISPVVVDDEIWNIIKKSLKISKQTKGLFDISYASIGHLWRKAKTENKIISLEKRKYLRQFINYKKIKLDKKKQSVFLPHSKMKIGLGGIGKGYAVDRIYDFLKSKGLYNFYINGSGDIRVHSHSKAPRPWRIGIRNPFSKDVTKSIGVIQLREGSIASSGSYIHKVNNKDFVDHHILNPTKGLSKENLITATVIGSDMITADTTATILMNLSSKNAIQYLDKQSLIGFVIDYQGKTHLSDKAFKSFGLSHLQVLSKK